MWFLFAHIFAISLYSQIKENARMCRLEKWYFVGSTCIFQLLWPFYQTKLELYLLMCVPLCLCVWSADDSSGSDDAVPLSKLLMKPRSEEKQSHEDRQNLTLSSSTKPTKDRSGEDNKLNRLSTMLPDWEKYFQLYTPLMAVNFL